MPRLLSVFLLLHLWHHSNSLRCATDSQGGSLKECSTDARACQVLLKDDRLHYQLDVCVPDYHFRRSPYRTQEQGCSPNPDGGGVLCWCSEDNCNTREPILQSFMNYEEKSQETMVRTQKTVSTCYAMAPWGKLLVECTSNSVGCAASINLDTHDVVWHENPCKDSEFFANLPKDQNCIKTNQNLALCWCFENMCNTEPEISRQFGLFRSTQSRSRYCIAQDELKNRFPHKCDEPVPACVTCSGPERLEWPENRCWSSFDVRMETGGCGYIGSRFCCWCKGDNCNTKDKIDHIFGESKETDYAVETIQCFVKRSYGSIGLETCYGNTCQVCRTGSSLNWDREDVCTNREDASTSGCGIVNGNVCCWCHDSGCNKEIWIKQKLQMYAHIETRGSVSSCAKIGRRFSFEITMTCSKSAAACQSCLDPLRGRFYTSDPCISTKDFSRSPYHDQRTGCAQIDTDICCWCDSDACNTQAIMQRLLLDHRADAPFVPWPAHILTTTTTTTTPTTTTETAKVQICVMKHGFRPAIHHVCPHRSSACQTCFEPNSGHPTHEEPCMPAVLLMQPMYQNRSSGCAARGSQICCWCDTSGCNTVAHIKHLYHEYCSSSHVGPQVRSDGVWHPLDEFRPPYLPPVTGTWGSNKIPEVGKGWPKTSAYWPVSPQQQQPKTRSFWPTNARQSLWNQIPQIWPRGQQSSWNNVPQPVPAAQQQHSWNRPQTTQNQWRPRQSQRSGNGFWGGWFPSKQGNNQPTTNWNRTPPQPSNLVSNYNSRNNWNSNQNTNMQWGGSQQQQGSANFPEWSSYDGKTKEEDGDIATRVKREGQDKNVEMCWATDTMGKQMLIKCPADAAACQSHVLRSRVIQMEQPCVSSMAMKNSTIYTNYQGCAKLPDNTICWCRSSACNTQKLILHLRKTCGISEVQLNKPLVCWGSDNDNLQLVTCKRSDAGCKVNVLTDGIEWLKQPCISKTTITSDPYSWAEEGCAEDICWCMHNQCNNEAFIRTLLNKGMLNEGDNTQSSDQPEKPKMEQMVVFSCWKSPSDKHSCPQSTVGCYTRMNQNLHFEWPTDPCISSENAKKLPTGTNCMEKDSITICWCAEHLCNTENHIQQLLTDFLNKQNTAPLIKEDARQHSIRCWSSGKSSAPQLIQCDPSATGCMVQVAQNEVSLAASPCITFNSPTQHLKSFCHQEKMQLICWCLNDQCNTRDHMSSVYRDYIQHVQPLPMAGPSVPVSECWARDSQGNLVLDPCGPGEQGCYVRADPSAQLLWPNDCCLSKLQLPSLPRQPSGCLSHKDDTICWCKENRCNAEQEMQELYQNRRRRVTTLPAPPVSCWGPDTPIECQNADNVCIAKIANGDVECPSEPCAPIPNPSFPEKCRQKANGETECWCTGSQCNNPENIMQIWESTQASNDDCQEDACSSNSLSCWGLQSLTEMPMLLNCAEGAIGCHALLSNDIMQYTNDPCVFTKPSLSEFCLPMNDNHNQFDCWCMGNACNTQVGIRRIYDYSKPQLLDNFLPCPKTQCQSPTQQQNMIDTCLTVQDNKVMNRKCNEPTVACLTKVSSGEMRWPENPCLGESDPLFEQVAKIRESCVQEETSYVCWCHADNCNSMEQMDNIYKLYQKLNGQPSASSDSLFPMPSNSPVSCIGTDLTGLTTPILCPETAVGCRASVINGQIATPGMPCLLEDEFTGPQCQEAPDSCFQQGPGQDECWCNDVSQPCNTPEQMTSIYSSHIQQMPYPFSPVVFQCLRLYHQNDVVQCHPGAVGCLASVERWSVVSWPPNPCVYPNKFYYTGKGPNSCYQWQTENMHYCWCNGDLCNTEPMIMRIFYDYSKQVYPMNVLNPSISVDSCFCQDDPSGVLSARSCPTDTVGCGVRVQQGNAIWMPDSCLPRNAIPQDLSGRLPCFYGSGSDPTCMCQESNCNNEYTMRGIIQEFQSCQRKPQPWCPQTGNSRQPSNRLIQSCLSFGNGNRETSVRCTRKTVACASIVINVGQVQPYDPSPCIRPNLLPIRTSNGCQLNQNNQCVCFCTKSNCNTMTNILSLFNNFGCQPKITGKVTECLRKTQGAEGLTEQHCPENTIACAMEFHASEMLWTREPCISSDKDLKPFMKNKKRCAMVGDDNVMCLCFTDNCNTYEQSDTMKEYVGQFKNSQDRFNRPKTCIRTLEYETDEKPSTFTYHKICNETSVGCRVVQRDDEIHWPKEPCISNETYWRTKKNAIGSDSMIQYDLDRSIESYESVSYESGEYKDSHCSCTHHGLQCYCLGSNCNKESTFRKLLIHADMCDNGKPSGKMWCRTDPDSEKHTRKCRGKEDGCRILIKDNRVLEFKKKGQSFLSDPCAELTNNMDICHEVRENGEEYTECFCRGAGCNSRQKAAELVDGSDSEERPTVGDFKCYKVGKDRLEEIKCDHNIGCRTVLEDGNPYEQKETNPCLTERMLDQEYDIRKLEKDMCHSKDNDYHILCIGEKCNGRKHVMDIFEKKCSDGAPVHGRIRSCLWTPNFRPKSCPKDTVACLSHAIDNSFAVESLNRVPKYEFPEEPCITQQNFKMNAIFNGEPEGCIKLQKGSTTIHYVWCSEQDCNTPMKIRQLGMLCATEEKLPPPVGLKCPSRKGSLEMIECNVPGATLCVYNVVYKSNKFALGLREPGVPTCMTDDELNELYESATSTSWRQDSSILKEQGCAFRKFSKDQEWRQDFNPICYCVKDSCNGFMDKFDNRKISKELDGPVACHNETTQAIVVCPSTGCAGSPRPGKDNEPYATRSRGISMGCVSKETSGHIDPGQCDTYNKARNPDGSLRKDKVDLCVCKHKSLCNAGNETGFLCHTNQLPNGQTNDPLYQCPQDTVGCSMRCDCVLDTDRSRCDNEDRICLKQSFLDKNSDFYIEREPCKEKPCPSIIGIETVYCRGSLCNTHCNGHRTTTSTTTVSTPQQRSPKRRFFQQDVEDSSRHQIRSASDAVRGSSSGVVQWESFVCWLIVMFSMIY